MIRSLSCLLPIRDRCLQKHVRTIFSGYRMAQKASPIYVSEGGAEDGSGSIDSPIKSVVAALLKSSGNVRYLFIKHLCLKFKKIKKTKLLISFTIHFLYLPID